MFEYNKKKTDMKRRIFVCARNVFLY